MYKKRTYQHKLIPSKICEHFNMRTQKKNIISTYFKVLYPLDKSPKVWQMLFTLKAVNQILTLNLSMLIYLL